MELLAKHQGNCSRCNGAEDASIGELISVLFPYHQRENLQSFLTIELCCIQILTFYAQNRCCLRCCDLHYCFELLFYLVEEAKRAVDEMRHRDYVSWNALISGYTQEGNYGLEAIWVFVEMLKEDLELDHVSFTGAISACGHERNLCVGGLVHAISSENLVTDGQTVHGFCLKAGFLSEANVSNSLITMYAKFTLMEECQRVFDELKYKEGANKLNKGVAASSGP
ncbi:hypothetical protein ACLOJK_028225 [Asimina triloba]